MWYIWRWKIEKKYFCKILAAWLRNFALTCESFAWVRKIFVWSRKIFWGETTPVQKLPMTWSNNQQSFKKNKTTKFFLEVAMWKNTWKCTFFQSFSDWKKCGVLIFIFFCRQLPGIKCYCLHKKIFLGKLFPLILATCKQKSKISHLGAKLRSYAAHFLQKNYFSIFEC